MNGNQSSLKRSLGVWDGICIVIANVIGIGIFTTPGIIAGIVPEVGAFLTVWILGGFLALIGALAYADLASFIPKAGGEYIYLKKTFGSVWGFLSGWTSFIAGFSGAIAASGVGFGEYLGVLLPDGYLLQDGFNIKLAGTYFNLASEKIIAISIILFITLFHIVNISVGRRFQIFLTLLNIATLLSLIIFGFASRPEWILMEQAYTNSFAISGWFLALIPVMFTYSGWNAAVYLAEEIKNPEKNMSRSLAIGTISVLVLYLLMNILIVGTIPFEILSGSVDVINTVSHILFGPSGMVFFSIVILTALLSSISAMIQTGPRVYFAMARDSLFPKIFGLINQERQVPGKAVCIQTGWAIVLVLSGTFEQLLIYTGFSIVLFSGLSVLSLLVRNKQYGIPIISPTKKVFYFLFVITSLAMVINAIVMSPIPSMAGLILIGSGLPIYYWKLRSKINI